MALGTRRIVLRASTALLLAVAVLMPMAMQAWASSRLEQASRFRPAAASRTLASTAAGGGSTNVADPFAGAGAWVDGYDFSRELAGSRPAVQPSDVDAMAAAGIRTLYLQAANEGTGVLLSPDLLGAFLAKAHGHGMAVVGWYMPHLSDMGADLGHLMAMRDLSAAGGFDGIGVDIEWRAAVPDPAQRSGQLIGLSTAFRALTQLPLAAIVMPPVVTDIINPSFWPGFPWLQLRSLFDVWMPMAYWTDRLASSPWHDPYRSTVDDIVRLRTDLGDPHARVHAIGGVGGSTADVAALARGAAEQGAVGVSVYDWAATPRQSWAGLAAFTNGAGGPG